MVMLANALALLLLSLVPDSSHGGRHALSDLVNDDAYRELLLHGQFAEYGAALDGALSERLAQALRGKRVSPAAVRDAVLAGPGSDLKELFANLKAAITVATFVTELQALGPAVALKTALGWVESGLIRKSGLRPAEFGSFFRIASRPERAALDAADARALARDLAGAESLMDGSFSKLASRLTESFF